VARSSSLRLPADLHAAHEARLFVCDACRRWGLSSEAAELVVSELVTNAVVHARSESELEISRHADGVLISVADGDSHHPLRYPQDLDALGGRGLDIVAVLASDWGVTDRPEGKVVWAVLDSTTDASFGQDPPAEAGPQQTAVIVLPAADQGLAVGSG
jgi:anti-sigma regulatory factor (Ser/Thr protein kinase)